MFLCMKRIVMIWIYFPPLSLYSEVVKKSNNNYNNSSIKATWNLYDVETFLTSNISDLSASTWSQNIWPTDSITRIRSAILPLNFNIFQPFDQIEGKTETTIEENAYENDGWKRQHSDKGRMQYDQLLSNKKSSNNFNLNTGSILVGLLKMMNFDANKLGSLTLNVLIMIGQTVSSAI